MRSIRARSPLGDVWRRPIATRNRAYVSRQSTAAASIHSVREKRPIGSSQEALGSKWAAKAARGNVIILPKFMKGLIVTARRATQVRKTPVQPRYGAGL